MASARRKGCLTCFLPADSVNRARTPTAGPTRQTHYITTVTKDFITGLI